MSKTIKLMEAVKKNLKEEKKGITLDDVSELNKMKDALRGLVKEAEKASSFKEKAGEFTIPDDITLNGKKVDKKDLKAGDVVQDEQGTEYEFIPLDKRDEGREDYDGEMYAYPSVDVRSIKIKGNCVVLSLNVYSGAPFVDYDMSYGGAEDAMYEWESEAEDGFEEYLYTHGFKNIAYDSDNGKLYVAMNKSDLPDGLDVYSPNKE